MAIHYLGATQGVDGEGVAVDIGALHMPAGRYLGFTIGPESDHDLVYVDAGDTVLVSVGSVIPIRPWEGQPRVRPARALDTLRDLAGSQSNGPARIHVIGLTDPCELAIAPPRRARARWTFERAAPTGASRWYIPIGGRRHIMVRIVTTVAGTIAISGVNRGASGLYATELVSVGGSTGDTWHLGGTDHEELFDSLLIEVDSTGQTYLDVDAVGELGG